MSLGAPSWMGLATVRTPPRTRFITFASTTTLVSSCIATISPSVSTAAELAFPLGSLERSYHVAGRVDAAEVDALEVEALVLVELVALDRVDGELPAVHEDLRGLRDHVVSEHVEADIRLGGVPQHQFAKLSR